MEKIKEMFFKLQRAYSNSGFWLELSISLIFVFLIFFANIELSSITNFIKSLDEATITFFGILFGFILTSFTFLLTFNPTKNSELEKLKKSEDYKRLLYSYISTASLILILVISLFILKFSYIYNSIYSSYFVLFLLVLTILKILKSLFYLYIIIELT